MFGVTEEGFKIKDFQSISNDIQGRYRVRLQDNNYVLDFNTPEGIHSEAIAYELKEVWENLLGLNNQMNIDTATGVYLDYFGTLLRTPRRTGSYATGQVKIIGNQNLAIPSQTVIKYAEKEYVILNNVVLDTLETTGDYSKIAFIQAMALGSEYNISTDVEFEFEYQGIKKITNDTDITGGENSEPDSIYRPRLKKQQATKKTAIHEALYNGLMALENVKDCIILDPETNPSTDPGTIKVFIDGTPNDNIFETILDLKADGILTLKDNNAQSMEKELKRDSFKRKIIYNLIKYNGFRIKVEVKKVKNEDEKDNRWTPLIKQEVLKYINNLKSGEGISYVKVYSEVLGIDDLREISLKMGTESSNVAEYNFDKVFPIPIGQKFQINEDNIEVLYV
jgi:baseplate J-like protein